MSSSTVGLTLFRIADKSSQKSSKHLITLKKQETEINYQNKMALLKIQPVMHLSSFYSSYKKKKQRQKLQILQTTHFNLQNPYAFRRIVLKRSLSVSQIFQERDFFFLTVLEQLAQILDRSDVRLLPYMHIRHILSVLTCAALADRDRAHRITCAGRLLFLASGTIEKKEQRSWQTRE